MDIEKIASGLIGGAITGLIYIGTSLVSKGKRDSKFEQVVANIEKLETKADEVEKSIATKVSLDRFEKEIDEIHVRMSRTQREQAAAIEKLDGKIDAVKDEVKFMSGVMSQIPRKLDELTEKLKEPK